MSPVPWSPVGLAGLWPRLGLVLERSGAGRANSVFPGDLPGTSLRPLVPWGMQA